jgi:uncharacterized protein (DUF305 family)
MRAVTMRVTAGLAALATATVVGSCTGAASRNDHAGHSGAQPVHDVHEHNAADVAFAQNMVPHHQQAVDMSAMVPSRTANPDLIVIASHIGPDQQAEIEVLQELLAQWGEPTASVHEGHEGHGAMGIDGMVDTATMTRLQSLTGREFDVLWLRSMIRHHQGAVAMARSEIVHGQNPDAVKMAKIIVEWQQFEIARMDALVSVPE